MYDNGSFREDAIENDDQNPNEVLLRKFEMKPNSN